MNLYFVGNMAISRYLFFSLEINLSFKICEVITSMNTTVAVGAFLWWQFQLAVFVLFCLCRQVIRQQLLL